MEATGPILRCARCAFVWPPDPVELSRLAACPACRAPVRIEVFPAWNRAASVGAPAQPVVEAGESACFYHAHKRAVVPCDQCGRFLCALCDVELAGRHYCPGCVHKGVERGAIAALERSRTRWDVAVWWLLVLPVILCAGLPMPLTALAALVLSLIKYKSPPSLVAHSRRWLRAGSVVAVIEIALGIALWIGLS